MTLLYDVYTGFVKENWKSYILYLITFISLPLQNVAMPHYYGEVINSLKDANLERSKYAFYILESEPSLEIGIQFIYIIDIDENVFIVKWYGGEEIHKIIFDIFILLT